MGQDLHIVDDRGTRRGEARHRFEVSIGEVGDAAVDEEGERSEEGEDDPHGCHQQEGVFSAQHILGVPSPQQEEESTSEGNQQRHQKGDLVFLVEVEGHRSAPGHEESLDEQQRTDDLADDAEVDHI